MIIIKISLKVEDLSSWRGQSHGREMERLSGRGGEPLPRASSRAENLSKLVTAMTAGRGAFIQRGRGAAVGILVRNTPLITTSSLTLLQRCSSPPSSPPLESLSNHPLLIPGSGEGTTACLAVKRLCSISTPEKVSHKHRAAAKNCCSPRRAELNLCVCASTQRTDTHINAIEVNSKY